VGGQVGSETTGRLATEEERVEEETCEPVKLDWLPLGEILGEGVLEGKMVFDTRPASFTTAAVVETTSSSIGSLLNSETNSLLN